MRTRTQAALTVGALVIVAAFAPASAQEAPRAPERAGSQAGETGLSFRFEHASIDAFLAYLSKEGGLTFHKESPVTGDITAIAEKPMSLDEALDVLRTWLLSKSLTIVRQGDAVRIVTFEQAKAYGLPVRVGNDPEQIPDTAEYVIQVIPLSHVVAADAKRELGGLLTKSGAVYQEKGSNSLIVSDTSANVRRMVKVLNALDTAVSEVLKIRVFRLKNADAGEVAKVITDIFEARATRSGTGGGGSSGGRGGNTGRRARQFIGEMFGGGGRGGPGGADAGGEGGGALTGEIGVASDKRTNAVVVTASEQQLKLIAEVVAELDQAPQAQVTEIKVYPLQNADAEQLVTMLDKLFAEQSTAQQQLQAQQQLMRRFRGGGRGGAPGGDDGGEDEDTTYAPKAKFVADTRTNTLVATASPADLRVVDDIVARLDADATETDGVLVIPLKNADATNVATVLTGLLGQSTTTGGAAGGNAANRGGNRRAQQQTQTTQGAESAQGLTGQVTVVADSDSNSLVINTAPKNFGRVRTLVADLDQVRRQVLVECMIAEVTLTNDFEFGVQWQANWTNSADNDPNGVQNAGIDFGLAALGNGFQYGTIGDNLTGLLRMLQTDGYLNVLSSPKILVLDNQDAEISVGQEVPFITNSRITTDGDTVNTVQYRTVGIILRVTPHINEDGTIRLVVHPEVSAIGPEADAVPITDTVRSPVFEQNFADTTIIVHRDETAVLGGLIRESEAETVEKIPLLGDIPLLGRLFSSTVIEKRKKELVVFLTPRVISSSSELRDVSRRVQEGYALVPQHIIDAEVERWTRDLRTDSATAAYNRGTIHLEYGRLEEAISELSAACAAVPEDGAARFNLGLAYARQGRLFEAERTLKAATLLLPADPEVFYNLGAVLFRRGAYPECGVALSETLRLDPHHKDARRWLREVELRTAAAPAAPGEAPVQASAGPKKGQPVAAGVIVPLPPKDGEGKAKGKGRE